MISVMSSSLEEGVSGRLVIGPDFFSRSARAFLKGVGVLGVSPLRKSLLLGVVMISTVEEEVTPSFLTEMPWGVLSGL